MTNADQQKRAAAAMALELVSPSMTLGLGTGSTAAHFVELLGEKVREGFSCQGIPTSEQTRQLAEQNAIPLIDPDETTQIDLAVDGADEIGPDFSLIKGGGGALLREKIIAARAKRFAVIADESKYVTALGKFKLPVEIVQFSYGLTVGTIRETLAALGFTKCKMELRGGTPNGTTFISDGGNFILDCHLERIDDPAALEATLQKIPGVVETGLFINMADDIFLAGADGVRHLNGR